MQSFANALASVSSSLSSLVDSSHRASAGSSDREASTPSQSRPSKSRADREDNEARTGKSLAKHVALIKETLGIDPSATIAAAVREANEETDLPDEGSLHAQVAALLKTLELERGDSPVAHPEEGVHSARHSGRSPVLLQRPSSGLPKRLTLRLSTGLVMSLSVPPSESVREMMLRVQQATGLHYASLRPVFAGEELALTATAEETLVDGSTLFVVVKHEGENFPARLAPFVMAAVPFSEANFDFQIQELPRGALWTMEERTLHALGVDCAGVPLPLVGQFSPTHPLTLKAAEKAAIHISDPCASQFAFSYPAASAAQLQLADGRAERGAAAAVADFLSVGGFVYLASGGPRGVRIVNCTTLRHADGAAHADGGLHFGPPHAWDEAWTEWLLRKGRFQRVTIPAFAEQGARHFCWLPPDEKMLDCAAQPRIPHGGFAYLFHDPRGGTADELSLDRYFPVQPPADVAEKAARVEAASHYHTPEAVAARLARADAARLARAEKKAAKEATPPPQRPSAAATRR